MPKPIEVQPKEHKNSPIYIVSTDDAQGIIDAVVNVFGIVDLGDDMIHNGSYTKTLNERGNQVKVRVLDSHNTDSIMRVIGKPLEIREIGRDELARIAPKVIQDHPEATGGLFTRTQFLMNTPEGEGAYKRLASGAVDEWSIALDPLQVEYRKGMTPDGKEKTVRHILQIKLYEYSPVIWGMNQATVTTDVKAVDESKADPEPIVEPPPTPEQKQGSLVAKLEANMRMGYAYCVNDWLSGGLIDANMITVLDGALSAGMSAFRTSIPASIGDQSMTEYYAANGSSESKVGRVISGANREIIQQAIDALQALMDASMPAQTDSVSQPPADEKSQSELEESSPVTGSEKPEAAPSITDAADIDRELSELEVMMEMIA